MKNDNFLKAPTKYFFFYLKLRYLLRIVFKRLATTSSFRYHQKEVPNSLHILRATAPVLFALFLPFTVSGNFNWFIRLINILKSIVVDTSANKDVTPTRAVVVWAK